MSQILYGKNVIQEVIRAGRRKIQKIYILGKNHLAHDKNLFSFLQKENKPIHIVDRSQLDNLTEGASHQGIVVEASEYPYVPLEEIIQKEKSLLLMCDSIQDPQNLGAICRSAKCFGVDGIILNKDNSTEVTPALVKASAGAVEHLKVAKVVNLVRALEDLKQVGFWSYAADVKGEESLESIKPSKKTVVILGAEGKGVRRLILEKSDVRFSIPMKGDFDSLNVAQAASIILYKVWSLGYRV